MARCFCPRCFVTLYLFSIFTTRCCQPNKEKSLDHGTELTAALLMMNRFHFLNLREFSPAHSVIKQTAMCFLFYFTMTIDGYQRIRLFEFSKDFVPQCFSSWRRSLLAILCCVTRHCRPSWVKITSKLTWQSHRLGSPYDAPLPFMDLRESSLVQSAFKHYFK